MYTMIKPFMAECANGYVLNTTAWVGSKFTFLERAIGGFDIYISDVIYQGERYVMEISSNITLVKYANCFKLKRHEYNSK